LQKSRARQRKTAHSGALTPKSTEHVARFMCRARKKIKTH